MKQKKLLTKAVCFSAAFVMLMMSLTLEPGIDLLNSWLRSSAEDNTSENTVAEIPINDNGYKIVETTEEVSIPTEVTFTWEEVTESFEEEATIETTETSEADTSDSDEEDATEFDVDADVLDLQEPTTEDESDPQTTSETDTEEDTSETTTDPTTDNVENTETKFTLSWKSKYVTASYQDGENNVVEIENGETELSAGTEVTVALTADGQNIYKSITLDKKSSDEESSSFIIDDSGEAIAKLTLRTTNVINNINVEGSDAPIITLPDNSNSVSYGQYIKVTPTTAYSVKVSNGNVTELIEKDKYVHVLGVNELTFTAERKSYDVSLINDAANYFTIDGINENKLSCENGDEVVVKLKEKADINGINVESLLRSVTVSNIDEIKKDYDNCTITFTMPANNVEISCDTSKFEYQVTLPESTDGLEICYKTSDSDEYEELKSGTYLTEGTEVKVVLKNGYSWSVDVSVTYKNANGEETKVDLTSYNDDSGELIYTFKMPSSPITIEATAEKVKYGEIATENCSVEATTEDGAIVFDEDGNASFTVTPKTNDDSTIGYIVKSVKLNDKEVSDEDKSVNENGVWTVTFNKSGIHDDVNISVEYVVAVTLKIDRYDGKSSTSISSNGNSVTANYNYDNNGISSIEVTAEATTGYHITSFIEEPNTYPNTYKDTEAASGVNNNQYNKKATAVYSDVSTWTGTKEITVTFAIDTFNITAGESTGNGEISVPESPIKYDNNNETEDTTVTATPNNDSYVSKIWCDNKLIFSTTVDDTVEEIDNISVDPDTSKNGSVDVKFSMVTADHTITAEFSDVEEVEPSGGLSFDDGSVVYSANLGSGAIYKYIIGGTNDENRSNLKLSFDNTDYSVSYFIGDINTAINSISYAGSCEVNSEKISFEEETNITFYLKNNSTYAVTKFTVTLVPDNEAPEIDTDTLKADPDYWTNGEVTIRGKVSDNGDVQSGVSKVYYRKGINGDFTLLSEDTDGNLETFEITLDEQNYNGVYQFYCVDRAGNESDTYDIQVQQDITAPTVDELIVDHDHNDWTNGKVTISGKVSDNLSGVAQVYYKRGDEEEFKQITTGTEQDDNGNITAFEITIDEQNYNGVYQFYCVDRAENMSDTSDIRVHQDITAPIVDSIEIDKNLLFTVIEKLTFGFYQAPITVTITASDPKPEEDENAVSEVKEIKYSYTGTKGKYSSEEVSGGSTVQVKDNKISFTVESDFRGTITATATDKAGNVSAVQKKINGMNKDGTTEELGGIVSDKTAPTLKDTYSEEKQIVNNIHYYDSNATLTIAITEANFYSEDVYVYVNGNKADPDGAWKTNGDVHTNTLTFKNDGEYIVTIEYTDKSGNVMKSYESEKIVIDTIDPTIKVEYDNNDVKNTVDGRQYFDKQRTAIITVTEHNFRADDIDVTVSAVDVTGNSVSVQDYHSYLSNRSSWTKQDDVYTAKITYSADANYTFDISYKDLALNETADYSEDKFTVDKTAPYDLKVTYENEPENTVGSTRYYGEQVHVMISAADDTSPIYRFEYEGKLTQNDPISAVNRSVLETIVESKTKEITREGNINKMDFYIPKELLNENNSFDGNVYFKAYDCAENNTDTTDATRLVTDKIAPTATVTFNGSEYTQKEYFNTNIDVNVSINEANFSSDDVIVSVTKDGSSYSGYSLKWNSSSVDSHLGSFTLTEDGDYVVTVTYTDKSGNKMQDYTSPVIVLDTVKPVVSIDPISGKSAHESAHNDETIGIKVAVTDKNIEAKDVELKLTAIINNNSDGAFVGKTIEIPIGEPTLSKNADGEMVLTYSIDNLEMDGYYTLKCNATDLATNENLDQTNEKHIIDDGKVQKEDIHFSVNRKGSVFWLEADCDGNTVDDINKNFNGQYLKAEVSVTFHEINVDPIPDENSTKKTLIKDNKEISDPDVEYSNDEIGSGGWYERKYTYQEENFEDDGRYTLRITTTDKAGNVNDSSTDDKSAAIRFTIDRTAPVIYSNVVEEQIDDGRYQGKTINKAEQTVEISFAEPNLDVEKLRIVRVDGENEEEIGDIHDLLDENNVVRFIENNVLNDNIKVYAYDLAGNKSTYDIVDLTVTTNIFALWYANTFIFWLSIIIFIVLAGLFILFIILKKRKRSEDEE